MTPRNLMFCNTYNSNVFCFSRPPIRASKIHPKMMFFQDAFLDTVFDDFMLISYETCRFGDSFKIHWAPKWDPKSTKWRLTLSFFCFMGVPCSRRVTCLNVEKRQVDWTFVLTMFFIVLLSPILAVQWLQNTSFY